MARKKEMVLPKVLREEHKVINNVDVTICWPDLTEEELEKNIQGVLHAANLIARDYGFQYTSLEKIK